MIKIRIAACSLLFGLSLSTMVAQSDLFENETPDAEEESGDFDPGSLDDATLDALIAGEDIDKVQSASQKLVKHSPWFREIILKAGGGYNDNVLQGPFVPQQSPFAIVSLETLFSRLPQPGKLDVYLYALAEQVEYTEAEDIDYERLAVVQGRVSGRLGESWTLGTTLQYMYTNQVFDVADVGELETNATALQMQQIEVMPFLERSFSKGFYLKMESGVRGLYFHDPADDYTNYSGFVGFGRNISGKSKIGLNYQYEYNVYKNGVVREADGTPVENMLARLEAHKFEFFWKRKWGKDRNFQTYTKMNIRLLNDNGVGYRDYTRYSIDQSLSYKWHSWTFMGRAKYTYYGYKIQKANPSVSELYSRTNVKVGAGVKKSLSEKLNLFLDYVYEESQSNRPEDVFNQNKIAMGFERTF